VLFPDALDELKCAPKFVEQRLSRVAGDRQTAACRRPIFRESGKQDMASWPQRSTDLPKVGVAIARARQEVKDGAIVPEIESSVGQLRVEHVGLEPAHTRGRVSQTRTGLRKCGWLQIEHREV
jgi:hypothetical protein